MAPPIPVLFTSLRRNNQNMETNPGLVGLMPMGEPVIITPEIRLRDLDRCELMVWCQGTCRHGRRMSIAKLIDRFGMDALIVDLAPKFKCNTPRCRAFGHLKILRLTGIHRPVGTEPYYW